MLDENLDNAELNVYRTFARSLGRIVLSKDEGKNTKD
jgi:hypothetical protein